MAIDVAYAELDGSPTEDWDASGGQFKASRRLKCAWADRHTLMAQLLAFPGVLYEHQPETLATARSAACVPFGGQNGAGTMGIYADAVITVNYASPRPGDPEVVGEDDVRSESLEPNAEFLTLDYRKFKWTDGDLLAENEAPGKLLLSCDYVVTRYAVENIPATVVSLVGHVNLGPVFASLLGISFSAQTLLYNPPVLSRTTKRNAAGIITSAWNVVQKFSARPQSWNSFWRAKTQTYEFLKKLDGTDYDNYPMADFNGAL